MQRVLKRTAQAEKQIQRRLKLDKKKTEREAHRDRHRRLGAVGSEIRSQRNAARKAWREDWELGPLAPFRDSPRHARDPSYRYWGNMASERSSGELEPTPAHVDASCRWAGGNKHLCLAPEDRVVIMDGPLKGKIGKIKGIRADMGTVTLHDIARANVTIPEFAQVKSQGQTIVTMDSSIPIGAVRMIHPIKNPKTGVTRDVIVKELKPVNISRNRYTKEVEFDRLVPGLNVEIPWPPKAEPEYKDGPNDTLRIDVEQKTFVPTLLKPPMPETVIDELRGRYSRFRTRHTAEYIAQKETEEAETKARKLSAKSMRTPLQELNLQQRTMRKGRGQPVLTNEMLEKIGQVIARNKMDALEAAGATEAETSIPNPDILEPGVQSPETRPPP